MVIAILLYQIIKSALLQSMRNSKERGNRKRQERFDGSQIVDAEFKEIVEDGEEKS